MYVGQLKPLLFAVYNINLKKDQKNIMTRFTEMYVGQLKPLFFAVYNNLKKGQKRL
jgi:hypothetical protein